MSDAKIKIQIGQISFSGEGDHEWLTEQLDKLLEKAADLIELSPPVVQATAQAAPSVPVHQPADFSQSSNIANQTLVSFLKSKNATTSQVEKFLATAVWIEAKEKKERLKTADVSSALSKASQSKINNPSDKLNQNVAKGYCEKEGKEFYVTQEGREHVGV